MEFTSRAIERFLSKVDKNGPLPDQSNPHYSGLDRCWLRNAAVVSGGYTQTMMDGVIYLAHRVSWMLANGRPTDFDVLHRCDVPQCVNPDHLWEGTHSENIRDMDRKGRGNRPSGDRHGSQTHPERIALGDRNGSRLHPDRLRRGQAVTIAKLTDEKVREIRSIYAIGKLGQRAIAAMFSVSQPLVGMIVRGEIWKHVV